jgi:hemerythrin-like domain-containing protein
MRSRRATTGWPRCAAATVNAPFAPFAPFAGAAAARAPAQLICLNCGAPAGAILVSEYRYWSRRMDGQRQVSRLLEEEHRSNLNLLGRVERCLARVARGVVPAEAEATALLRHLVQHLQRDVGRHFDFEEQELFARLQASGDADIALLLREEHDAIREVAAELLPLAEAAVQGTLDAPGWQLLRSTALEMVERQVAHIQKESMTLLPLLDEWLDDETDQQLALSYAAG